MYFGTLYLIKSNVCHTIRASSRYLLFIRTNKTISSLCTLDSPACRYAALLNNLAAECILVEDTTKFILVIAFQCHWHYGREQEASSLCREGWLPRAHSVPVGCQILITRLYFLSQVPCLGSKLSLPPLL